MDYQDKAKKDKKPKDEEEAAKDKKIEKVVT